MLEPVLIVWAGAVAGLGHVYMGADHLAALMPIAVGRRLRAAWLGVRWGIGHSLGVLVVAGVLLAARTAIDLEPVGVWSERLVGVMLIGLGALGLRAAFAHRIHAHEHSHDGEAHVHVHVHVQSAHAPGPAGAEDAADAADDADTADAEGLHRHPHAALAAGTLHGVAGMAHLMGVLPSLALPTLAGSLVYLAAFAVGSIAGMALFAGLFGAATARLGDRAPRLVKGTMVFAASACVLVGVAWIALPLLGVSLG